jgi:hypothetical protein
MVCVDCASEEEVGRDIAAKTRDNAQEAAAATTYRTRAPLDFTE